MPYFFCGPRLVVSNTFLFRSSSAATFLFPSSLIQSLWLTETIDYVTFRVNQCGGPCLYTHSLELLYNGSSFSLFHISTTLCVTKLPAIAFE